MRKLTSITLIFVLALLLISCSDGDSPTSSDNPKKLWPLNVGNTWILSSGDTVSVDTTIDKTENTYFGVIFSGEGELMVNKKTGLYVYNSDSERAELFLKYPIQEGESYSGYYDNNDLNIVCLNVDTNIVTNAGSFNSIVYSIDNPETDWETIWYVSPGIGIVGGKYNNEINTLEFYNLK